MVPSDTMRIDRLLCYLRFVKTRSQAQRWIDEGHIRCNGMRVTRHSHPIGDGDIIVLPTKPTVKAIEILAIPARRDAPAQAQSCYRVLDPRL